MFSLSCKVVFQIFINIPHDMLIAKSMKCGIVGVDILNRACFLQLLVCRFAAQVFPALVSFNAIHYKFRML